jgi:hypothetical protein
MIIFVLFNVFVNFDLNVHRQTFIKRDCLGYLDYYLVCRRANLESVHFMASREKKSFFFNFKCKL